MPWTLTSNDCVAANNTPEQPAFCICSPPTLTEAPSPVEDDTYSTDCQDCGKYGYISTLGSEPATGANCCSISGTIYESP